MNNDNHKTLQTTTLLTFFLSLPSLTSDSLKVKKIEYYDNNILVREVFFDTLGRKTKDIFSNFQDMYHDRLLNEVAIIKYKNGKHFTFTTYFCKVENDSVYFYNCTFMGNFPLKSFEGALPKDEQEGRIFRYNYNMKGNQISRFALTNNKITHETYYKYDTLNRLVEDKDIAKPIKSFT